jgi:perosamine synthetase
MIRVFEPDITKKDISSVLKALKNKDISGSSSIVTDFENSLCNEFERKYAVTVSDLSFQLLNLKEGDEVIIPSHTIISCLSAVLRTKAKPIFCDVNSTSWNMTVEDVKKVITKNTKAVLLVHTFGLTADAKNIVDLCSENNIHVIEDAAEAHGQFESKIKCGSFGLISTFSFYANKHITTGEGGAILTDSEEVYKKARQMRNLDFSAEQRFKTENLYWNYRMGGLQAALGISQIANLKTTINHKITQGNIYQELLKNNDEIITLPPKNFRGSENHYWVFGILLKKDNVRDKIMTDLYNLGIETRPFFWPLHQQPSLPKEYLGRNNNLPVSEKIGRNGFYIPLGRHVTKNIQKKISYDLIETVKKY